MLMTAARAQRSGCEMRTAGCSPGPGKSSVQMSHCCLLIVIHAQGTHLVQRALFAIAPGGVEMPDTSWRIRVRVPLRFRQPLQRRADDFAITLVEPVLQKPADDRVV